VTLQAKGDYCVSVPGRSPLTSSIVVSPDLEHDGTRQSGATEAHSTIVETDGACAGVLDDNHGFRVRTFDQRVNNNPVVLPADDGFTFIVS
jgi:hypothetical protein